MMKIIVLTGSLMVLSFPAMAIPAPQEEGKVLHDTNCVSCHHENVYTRAEHRVKNFSALQNQVQRCTNNLKLNWFDSENDAVTNYLNTQYYKFTHDKK